MRQVKISSWLASAVVCSLLLAAGCAPLGEKVAKPEVGLEEQMPEAAAEEVVTPVAEEPAKPEVGLEEQVPEVVAEEAATLALKFTPQDLTTYRVITETQRSVKWEGPLLKEPIFKGGRKLSRLEMTFTQQIQSTDDEGNAIVKITVEELKYSSLVEDRPVLDFDSSKPKDPNHPLALLIGQGYTIKIAPTGEVTEVIEVKEARVAVGRGSSVPRTALRLLRSGAIKERHGLLTLPVTEENRLRTGDNWSDTKTFSFGEMGSKSYEKIYTMKEIKDVDGRQIAVVEMNAIPASEMAEQLYKEDAASGLSETFDSTGTYTGQLKLDLTTGKVEKYLEKLETEWIAAFPSAEQEDDKEPTVLIMSDTRLYSLEKID